MENNITNKKQVNIRPSVDSKGRGKDMLTCEIHGEHTCLIKKMYNKYPNTTVLTILGLLIAILFIALGFWATILIILLSGTGFVYGQYKDKSLWVYYMIKRLLK
ncbi:DUF2273 domain-containing protein [Eubacteriales bacterium KG127]